jgi:hypothetical protein
MTPKIYTVFVALTLSGLAARTQTRPITDAEALATGHRLEGSFNSGDSNEIDRLLSREGLLERVREKCHALSDPVFFGKFREGFMSAQAGFGQTFIRSFSRGNSRLLKEFNDKGTTHLFFRMFGAGGLNYDEFILIRVGDSIRWADVYAYSTEEWTSSGIARLTDIANKSSGLLADAGAMIKMAEQMRSQDYAGAKATYDQFAKEYQNSKMIKLMYVHACAHIDKGLYAKALEEYTTAFPDAASGYLMMLDLYYLQKEYDKVLVTLDKLDKLVGGDPVLDFYRGNAYTALSKTTESLGCYERVYRYDPSIVVNSLKLARVYAESGEGAKAKAVVAGYKNTVAYREGDLTALYTKYPELKE